MDRKNGGAASVVFQRISEKYEEGKSGSRLIYWVEARECLLCD